MKIEIGHQCIGSGECEFVAPNVFAVGEDSTTHVIADEAALAQYRADVEEAVLACPTGALSLAEDDD